MFKDFSKEVLQILQGAKADFRSFQHESAFTFAELEALGKKLGWQGQEMKNLLLCDKKAKRFFLAVTLAAKQVDFAALASIFQEKKLKLASDENVEKIAHAKPGCLSPFGFSSSIPIAVDEEIFTPERLLFSGGSPSCTIEISSDSLRRVFSNLENEVIFQTF